jgi:CheY-like chemotaxis protein
MLGYSKDVDYKDAFDGQQALDLVKEHAQNPFKLILMDLQMPVLDGFLASKQIMEHCGSSNPPAIYACTASDPCDELDKKIKEHGMVDTLPKPLNFIVLK